MARKVGFGRKRQATETGSGKEKNPDRQDRERTVKLIRQLVVLGLIEAVGVAVFIRGFLTSNPMPIVIGIAWMVLVSLVTLRVVLQFSGMRKNRQMAASSNWPGEDDPSP